MCDRADWSPADTPDRGLVDAIPIQQAYTGKDCRGLYTKGAAAPELTCKASAFDPRTYAILSGPGTGYNIVR